MRRAALSAVIGGLMIVAGALDADAVPSSYSGQITSGSGSQGGVAIFSLDPASGFAYSFDDVSGNGLDAGDVVSVNATVNIQDSALGTSLGSLTLTGTVTVGGATGGYYSNALGGSLSYVVSYNTGSTESGSVDLAGGILGYGSSQPDLRFSLSGAGSGNGLGFALSVRGQPADCTEVPPPPGCGPTSSVPEPHSLAFLGGGLVALGLAASRFRRR